jgi:DedD protein
VPVFLDGPPEDGEIVSERVMLPGQEDQKNQTVVLDRNRTQPVPAATTPAAAPVRQEPARQEPVQEEPVREEHKPDVVPDKPVEEPAPKPAQQPAASTTGMWAVQLGSFSNKENAEKLAADLRKQGYAAFLSQLTTENGQLHRVRIGPQKDRESAEEMAKRLAKVGQKGQVVPHP